MKKTITIIGSGYVGTTLAAILANSGYKTYALDIDQNKIDTLKQGKSFFYELGLDSLIKSGIESQNLLPTTSYEEAVPDADIIFSCVGTPDNPDGSSNLSYVFAAIKEASNLMKSGAIYVQRSTVPVGTGRKNIEIVMENNPNLEFNYVSNPEFLRESSAVYDTLNPSRIVVGGDDSSSLDEVIELFKKIHEFAVTLESSDFSQFANTYGDKLETFEPTYVKTKLESAELIKVTANAFLATKISFANSIAKLSDKFDADVNEVMDGIGFDNRIGRAFLYAGLGWGGGCFPKDVSGLSSTFEEAGISSPIINAIKDVNYAMPSFVISKLKEKVDRGKVAILGLSFKPGTSDCRKSPAILLAENLIENGYEVQAYDPKGMEEAKHEGLNSSVELKNSLNETVSGADIVVLATEWPEFLNADWANIQSQMNGNILIDGRNRLSRRDMEQIGFEYIGIGR